MNYVLQQINRIANFENNLLTNLHFKHEKFFKQKNIFIVAALTFGFTTANAQSFTKGTSAVHLGVGIGSDFGLPISASYEYGITEKIGIGAYAGYTSKSFPVFNDSYDVTYMLFGARANYHFYVQEKFDTYGGIQLGYNAATAKWKSASNTSQVPTVGGVTYGFQVGARYYFTDKIGAFADAGY